MLIITIIVSSVISLPFGPHRNIGLVTGGLAGGVAGGLVGGLTRNVAAGVLVGTTVGASLGAYNGRIADAEHDENVWYHERNNDDN
jgi:uncharacterized protein YcfJ